MLASSEETFEEAGASSAAQTFGPLLCVKNDVCVCVVGGGENDQRMLYLDGGLTD